MVQIEHHNLQQIEDLNQRGGRTLSIVDLIEANTLSLDMAAYLLHKVSNGASFLTAARPGGAGKTTLLACLLSFLRPGTRIVTVSSPEVISAAPAKTDPANPLCFLAHEIGAGHYYGYIWGQDVLRFLALKQAGHIVASCLHADTLAELSSILIEGLDVPEGVVARVDLLLFMHVAAGYRRRVATVYESVGKKHVLRYQWESATDTYRALRKEEIEEGDCRELLARLLRDGVREFSRVRAEIARFLLTTGGGIAHRGNAATSPRGS